MRINLKAQLPRITAAMLVFLLSFFIMPFYTDGDQYYYRKAYEGLRDSGLVDGFMYYVGTTGSKEFMHYFLSWVASRFMEKDFFISCSNGVLAYVAVSLFQKWKASIIIIFFLLLTNFYFLVLYFSAERLKFGFIFLALSMLYIHRTKKMISLAFLALISHAQTMIVYLSILFNFGVKQIVKAIKTATISKSVIYIAIFLCIPPLLLGNHIASKFQSYYTARDVSELAKNMLFFSLALWYSKNRIETVMIFLPIFVITFLVGGDRVNVLGYFIFLYYGMQVRKGWNIGVLASSAYFSWASINFLTNVIEHGDGFFTS